MIISIGMCYSRSMNKCLKYCGFNISSLVARTPFSPLTYCMSLTLSGMLTAKIVFILKTKTVHLFTEYKKVIILGDSIPKRVSGIEGVALDYNPGDTIAKMARRIHIYQISLERFDYVLIHVGTNDVDDFKPKHVFCKDQPIDIDRAFNSMISDYGNLNGIIRKNPNISILISAILPRPKDHKVTHELIKKINGYLEKQMSKTNRFTFLRSYKPFMYGGNVKKELFARKDGGLHLNTEGTNKLRYFFLRYLASVY